MFEIELTQQVLSDIEKHKKVGDKKILLKINSFYEELQNHPFTGTGKPEQLKHQLHGRWSRRINKEHRLIYKVEDNIVYVLSAFGHYM
jgi:toxin YoeB